MGIQVLVYSCLLDPSHLYLICFTSYLQKMNELRMRVP